MFTSRDKGRFVFQRHGRFFQEWVKLNRTASYFESRESINVLAKDNQGQDQVLDLEELLYVPQYTKVFVSIKKLNEHNASVHFDTRPRLV